MKSKKISVILPTYNEKENIVPLVREILNLPLDITVIIVDDDSPDFTGYYAQNYFKGNERVKIFIRKEKRGRGYAGRFGYEIALKEQFDIIGEMDADFSHSPTFISGLVNSLEGADVASGSRFLSGSKSLRQNIVRKMITLCARFYVNLLLRINLTDPTSGFRFFNSYVLRSILPELRSTDPFIVTEVFYYVRKKGFSIKEYPIVFYERKHGKSKLKFFTLIKYLYRVLLLRMGLFYG